MLLLPGPTKLLAEGFRDRRFHSLQISGPFKTGYYLARAINHDV